MNGKVWFWAALALAGSAEAQVPVSTRCFPDPSELSACLWTGDCPREGCADKCIINTQLTQSWDVLLDRSIGEESYAACPLLAHFINLALPTPGLRRRLLSNTDASEILQQGSRTRTASKRAVDVDHRSRRRMQSLFDADAPSPGTFHSFDYADTPSPSPLVGGGEPLPAFTRAVPSNACPLPSDFDEAGEDLQILAFAIKEVFAANASGEGLPSYLEDKAFLLDTPNFNQFVVKMLEDPQRLKQYMTEKCVTETISGPRAFEYLYWIYADDKLDSDLTMTQCIDNFGAWERFERNSEDVSLSCSPPFDAQPDCFSHIGHYVITSPACATAYARLFNISNATTLAIVAANVNAIQEGCTRVTTEEDCLAANTPVLNTIDNLHDSIPISHALDIDVIAVDVVCFGASCSPPPAAFPPAASPSAVPPQTVPAAGAAPVIVTPAVDHGLPAADAPGPGGGPEASVTDLGVPENSTSDSPDPPVTLEPGSGQRLTESDLQDVSSAFLACCSIAVAATLLQMVLL